MKHLFDVDIAIKYGVNVAVILENMNYWIKKNEANDKHFYEGKYWTYNSIKAFHEMFPYMSERQISYCLNKMVELGLIEKGNFNKLKYDQTCWYAITDFGNSILQNCQMEETKLSNGLNEIVKPIPNINTDINTDVNTYIKKESKKKKETLSSVIDSYTDNEELKDCLKEFVEMRKAGNKGMFTVSALKKNLGKLDKLAINDGAKIDIVNQTLEHTWKGFYPIQDGRNNQINNHRGGMVF